MKKRSKKACFWQMKFVGMRCLKKFLFIFSLLVVVTQVYAQQEKISISLKNASSEKVFQAVRQQSDYRFVYGSEEIKSVVLPVVELKDVSIREVMDVCLKGTNLIYLLENNVVIVRKRDPQEQQKESVRIVGTITDEKKQPLPGVTVMIKGTNLGTATDMAGKYSLTLPEGEDSHVLIFTMVGMETQEIRVDKKTEINVVMKDAVNELEDVVVTGIFKKARESYTGAVSTITKNEIMAYRGQNMLQTLRNIDPAFNVMENNEFGSDPNRLPDITVRGNSSLSNNLEEFNAGNKNNLNTPLIIMDGFEISLTKLMDYNDEEIESINILKDAAATAIYGSRGANGVVVIVTRQPEPGKLKVYAQAGFTAEIPDLSSYNLMNAAEKIKLEWEGGLCNTSNPERDVLFKQAYYKRLKAVQEGVDTAWLSQPLHTGIGQNYNFRFEGGSDEFRWAASVGYKDIQGAMIGSERKTFNGSITLSYTYKNLIFRNQASIGRNKSKESPYGEFSKYAEQQPYHAPYDMDGKLNRYFDGWDAWSGQTQNPLYDATLNNVEKRGYMEVINNFSIEWKMFPELTLRGQFGISHKDDTYDKYRSPESSEFMEYTGDQILRKGTYEYTTGKTNTYEGNLTLSYSRLFKEKHSLYVGLDGSIAQSDGYSYNFKTEGFTNDRAFIGNALNYPQNGRPSATESKTRRVGLVGNINYVYDNRYYADFSLRTDGSSQFGSKNRFATFWSAGVGWNIHQESFLSGNDFFNTLRLRFSYGETGSQKFEAWQALSMFEYYTDKRYGIRSGSYLKGLGNEDLKWQVTSQYNVGLEFTILNNRIKGNFDYYVKETNNLLSSMSLPLSTGFPSYMENIGVVQNTGYEVSLNGYLIRDTERDIIVMLSAKLAYNKDKITKLSEDIKRQTEVWLKKDVDIASLFYEGRSQNSLYAVRSLGIDPSSGEEIFLDKNGIPTYDWSPSDKVYMGVNEPLYNGNAGLMFSWKDLSVNLSFGYHWGGKLYNSTLIDKVEVTKNVIRDGNVDKRVLSARWLHDGDVVFFKGISDVATRATSRFVMRDNVFELQSANVQYKWHAPYLQRLGLQTVTFSVNMSDLFYVSSVKRERGTSYPFTRTIGASVSLLF